MKITIAETVWQVSRQLAPAGWRADGEHLQQEESGLWFRSDRGENRFLPLDSADLPAQERLEAMPLDELIALWQRATER